MRAVSRATLSEGESYVQGKPFSLRERAKARDYPLSLRERAGVRVNRQDVIMMQRYKAGAGTIWRGSSKAERGTHKP